MKSGTCILTLNLSFFRKHFHCILNIYINVMFLTDQFYSIVFTIPHKRLIWFLCCVRTHNVIHILFHNCHLFLRTCSSKYAYMSLFDSHAVWALIMGYIIYFTIAICFYGSVPVNMHIWAITWEYGTYYILSNKRLKQACTNVQTPQSLRCLHTQSIDVDKVSDQNLDS